MTAGQDGGRGRFLRVSSGRKKGGRKGEGERGREGRRGSDGVDEGEKAWEKEF